MARGVARGVARGGMWREVGRDRDRGQHLGSGQFFEFVFVFSRGRSPARVRDLTGIGQFGAYLRWASRADSGATLGLLLRVSPPRPPRTAHADGASYPRVLRGALAKGGERPQSLVDPPARRPPVECAARRPSTTSSASSSRRPSFPSARMALEEQRPRRPPFRMAQAPQSGPQGQSKTVTVTITGARRARRAARAPAPEGGCHHSAHPRPRNKQP